MENTTKLFTFKLIDGRHVSYAGTTERTAFLRARAYHNDAVEQVPGVVAERCECSEKCALPARQNGWLICTTCAGYMG